MTAVAKLDAMKRIAAFVAVREKMAGTDPEVITESNGVPLLMSDLRAALSPAELGGVVTFDVVREVVKARTRLGFASPEGQEEQAARAIELIRELCEEVVNLNTASWAAEVITVTEPGDKGVRIRWRGGFPQVGDKLYATPRAAEAEWLPIDSAPVATDALLTDVETCLVYGQKIGRQLGRAWRYVDGSAQAQAYGFHGFNDDITHWRPLPAPPSLTPPSAKGE